MLVSYQNKTSKVIAVYRFFQLAIVSMLGVLITGGPLSDLDLPKVSGWQLPDGTTVFHEYELINAGIDCDQIWHGYHSGSISRCDDGSLTAATGDYYDNYATSPGAKEISYSPVTKTISYISRTD